MRPGEASTTKPETLPGPGTWVWVSEILKELMPSKQEPFANEVKK